MSVNTYVPRTLRAQINDIIREEAEAAGLEAQALLDRGRARAVDAARARAMYRARLETRLSYPQIAAVFRRDHTSVRNACLRLEAEEDKHIAV